MATGPPQTAQVVQTTGDFHDEIRQAFGRVAELVFGNATDLHASHRMLHPHSRSRQMAIVALLACCQRMLLGLFFGCRSSHTAGA